MKRAILCATLAITIAGCSSPEMRTTQKATNSSNAKPIKTMTGATAGEKLAVVSGGPAQGKRDPKLETVATFAGPAMPVGVAVSKEGRIFLSFPRWLDPVKNTVVELKDGELKAFPDAETNAFDFKKMAKMSPAAHFVSPQAIVFDKQNRLWILDPGSFNFSATLPGGPKLWAYDINSGKRVKAISFPSDVALKTTALNDVRFNLDQGTAGMAYITDSNVGGIIVVDLASGKSWRQLDGEASVMPVIGLQQTVEGKPLKQVKPSGEVAAVAFASDGIAISDDGKTLYYNAIVSHDVYSLPTGMLANKDADPMKVKKAIKKVATKPSGNDGMIMGPDGMLYTTDFEDNAIRQVDPKSGSAKIFVRDERLLWPDTLAIQDGYLYITSNQLARQPSFNGGKDLRQPPYALFRVKLEK